MPKLPTIPDHEIVEQIGHGGMGVVFRAVHRGKPVAVKLILESLKDDSKICQRFLREIKALAALQHPHVIRVHATGVVDARHWYSMDLLDAHALEDLVEENEAVEPKRAMRLLRQAADALACCHAAGLVHRDLKPSNLMVDARDHLTMMDFGLARIEGGTLLTATGQVMGTPGYLSPDTLKSQEQNAAGDVYALGVVFHELIRGRRAFAGETLKEVLQAILRAELPPLDSVQEGVPRELARLIGRMLAPEGADRPTAADVVTEVDRMLAAPPSRPARPARPASRPRPVDSKPGEALKAAPGARAVAAVVVAIAVLVAGAGLWFTRGDGTADVARATPEPAAALPRVLSLALKPVPPRRVRVEAEVAGAGARVITCTAREAGAPVTSSALPEGARPLVLEGFLPGRTYDIALDGLKQARVTMPRPFECALDVAPGDTFATVAARCLEVADFEVWVQEEAGGRELLRERVTGRHSFFKTVRELEPHTAYRAGVTPLDPARYPASQPTRFRTRAAGYLERMRGLIAGIQDPLGGSIACVQLADLGEPASVPEMLKLLADPSVGGDEIMMMQLTRGLAGAHDPRAIDPIVAMARKDTDPTRAARYYFVLGKTYEPRAFDAIVALGPKFPPRLELCSSYACALMRSDPVRAPVRFEEIARGGASLPERWAAANAITEMHSDRLAPRIAAFAAADPDPRVGVTAAGCFARFGTPACAAALGTMASAKLPEVREAVATALGRIGGRDALSLLIPMTAPSEPAPVRAAAAHALGQLGGADAVRRLGSLLGEGDPRVARAAAGALGLAGPDQRELAIAELTVKLQAGTGLAGRVPRALGQLRAAGAADGLAAMVAHGTPADRGDALWALARIAPQRALPLARAALADPDAYVKVRAIEAVGSTGTPEDGPALDAAAKGGVPPVRQMAELARRWLAGERPAGEPVLVDGAQVSARTGVMVVPGDRVQLRVAGAWAETPGGPLKGPAGGGEQIRDSAALALMTEVGSGVYDLKTMTGGHDMASEGPLALVGNSPANPDGIGFLSVWIDHRR